ncbi:MAG TPA: CHAT domain-containing protein [Thermoanaerobaculia bacterium]|nr:CHAT domain-containing protein [Thermoanaerobaculia bacterium]
MTDDTSRCPTPEQIAAFVAGSLSGDELKMVADHLRECEDCRLVAAEGARVDRESEEPAVAAQATVTAPRRRVSPWWLAAAAAALAGIVYFAVWPGIVRDGNGAIHRLVEAAPRDGRYIEPRLTGGFAWAPIQPVRRDSSEPLEPRQMKLVGVAGEVLEETANDPSPEAQHATALAHLLAGRPNEAAAVLTRLSAAGDARVLSDLAAARYSAGVQLNQPVRFAEALAAADAALRIDSKLPEALFNRALIVERLGLRDRARDAWQRYLTVDPDGDWAGEARKHLQQLQPVGDFREELERHYARLVRDDDAARELARRYPQEARLWGETQILGRWAAAYQQGHQQDAETHLRLARTFGDELARSRGDRMLRDAVAAVDDASQERRAFLAQGHVHFREAQQRFMAARPLEAGPLFEQAVMAFERGGTPVVLLARYFLANTKYDRGWLAESQPSIEGLLATAPPQYPANRAQLQWQVGLGKAAEGKWGAAIGAFDDSIRTFEQLGEKRYAAIVRGILAEVYDQIGDPLAAATNRMLALQELGRTEDTRLQVTVQAAARAAALEQNWPVSLSFFDLLLDMPRGGRSDLLQVNSLLVRARIHSQLGQKEAAAVDLAEATAVIPTLQDPDRRARAEADRLAVAGFLAASPPDAVANLTRALEFHRVKGRRMFLPEMHLARGRAHAAMGNRAAAAKDFETGILELETQRLSLEAGDDRWGMFASGAELFDEAVALALARGDEAAAFAYSERARARELLDSMGETRMTQVVGTLPAAPADTVLIEYASLPSSLVTFIVDRRGLRVVQTPVSRATLARDAERLAESATARDAARFRRNAAELYSRLLLPIADEMAGGRTLVFVPDATLSAVPFAALIDPAGKHLIEDHTIMTSPSAAVFARLAARPRPARRDLRLLLIAGPAGQEGDIRQLTSAQREADAVAAAYHETVEPKDGDPESFESRAAEADIIHFVGHADIPGSGSEGALVASRGANGRLDVRSIATLRLPRTRVVVLAACGTARGQQRAGEATLSIARAFLAAGAPSVVATLWPIDDDPAAEFFPRLHRYLADGLTPAEAVRATQLEWIRRRDAPPGLWAAVQIIGS